MSESHQFRVSEGESGLRLDEFLATKLARLSRMRIYDLLAGGACRVNGATATPGRRMMTGDLAELTVEHGPPTSMNPEPIPLEVVHEDEHLLVVNKPAGMLVHPTRGVKSGTLANALAYHLNCTGLEAEADAAAGIVLDEERLAERSPIVRPGIVHRLDRATSGLMVVAKRQRALSILTRHFHHRLVEKRYLALVRGQIADDEHVIEAPIGRSDEEGQPKWRVMDDGKPVETLLRVLKRGGNMTLVELEPVTGRTNQLRIHCAHIGHAIVGDEWYGTNDDAPRLCLHSAKLAFHHPANGEWVQFASSLPAEIARLFIET